MSNSKAAQEGPVLRSQPVDIRPVDESTRRSFLVRIGLAAAVVGLAGQAYAFFRSLVPNVLYEEPPLFKIGTPDRFGEGVSFLDDRRIFIFRTQNTFQAMSAVCTHLGCTVNLRRLNQAQKVSAGGREFMEQQEFICPCHGSKYYGDGTNYAGPAPRPLPFFRLDVSPDDGQLVVDAREETDREFRLTV